MDTGKLTELLYAKAFARIVDEEDAPSEREHIDKLEKVLTREQN